MVNRFIATLVGHLLGTYLITTLLYYILFNHLLYILSPIFAFFLWISVAAFTLQFTKRKFLAEEVKPENKAVLITGCNSGFGHFLAKRLDSKGFHVFATCLSPAGKGVTELKKSCSQRLRVLQLDVTKDDSVKEAAEFVKQNLGTCEFWALVNNAGTIKGFSLELSDMDDIKYTLDVNTLGPIRMIKEFLPLLKKSKGRIVNITSLSGVIAFPLITPYTISKYAAVGLAESLKQELDMWGIKVVSIEPELFQTGISSPENVDRQLGTSFKKFEKLLKDDYKDPIKYFTRIKRIVLYFASPKVSAVVDDLESAVSLAYPDNTYKCRRNGFARFIVFCYEVLPRTWQLNIAKAIMRVLFPTPVKSER